MLLALGVLTPRVALAQGLPSEPVALVNGRLVLGADVAATVAPEDLGFFNYSDYEHSTLRELRAGLTAAFTVTDRVSFLGEVRTENLDSVEPFALYARVRPWRNRRLDVQVGRIPPTFGAFTRRAYGHDNPLIGYPLAYQYLTSLRHDAIPLNADELIRMRGRGWLSQFGGGNLTPARGLPLVTVFSWDTGLQVTTGWRAVEMTASVTNGSASSPRVEDDNGGKQIAARVVARPAAGLVVGTSFARGAFVDDAVFETVVPAADTRAMQQAFGLDVEAARGRWMTRADAVLSDWTLPVVGTPRIDNPLRAIAVSLEGRVTVMPGLYAAARAEHLTFSRVWGVTRTDTWDAPVTRVEVGGGYYLQRNLIARFSVQVNRRDGGRVTASTLPAVQLLYWF